MQLLVKAKPITEPNTIDNERYREEFFLCTMASTWVLPEKWTEDAVDENGDKLSKK